MPTVSVVIPAFNAQQYIGEALASVRDQTLRDVEVILVDDGSTDNTLQEARRFADAIDLRIVRQPNRGPSAARNNGVRLARGRYCAFLDSDDIMLPELLAAQSAMLDGDAGLGLVLSDVMTFDERGTIHQARWNLGGTPDASLERLLLENFVTTSAVMAPTERLCEAGLFSEHRRVAEDYELWLRIAARWKIGFIGRALVRYRYSKGSLSSDKMFSARSALDVIEQFLREHDDYQRGHRAIVHRSLAMHLTNAGAAASVQGERAAALMYLARALAHEPASRITWRWLARTLVPSAIIRRPGVRPSGAL